MVLELLPTRTAGAAENMAVDFLLLQRYPRATTPRFRHYDWRGPAFTFGYAQKIAAVRELIASRLDTLPGASASDRIDLCRRPTGGGVVDHRADWTYALVIPRGHPLEEQRATLSYRIIHEAVAEALRSQGVAAVTKTSADETDPEPQGVCFQRAEVYDVIDEATGAKIAGAAQKRNKHGLLFQGSLWRPAAAVSGFEWDQFESTFVSCLVRALETEAAEAVPWPEFNEEEVSGLIDQYASAEWNEFR
jgi:lipoyl(octanoyl) transferase